MQATVKFLTNGYSVVGIGDPGTPIQSHYAATLAEAVYWIGQLFGIVRSLPAPQTIEPIPFASAVTNPMISQMAEVAPLSGGGFIARALPNRVYNTPVVEEYCVDMDAVNVALVKIYTYTPTP